jgi:hypothetical protein
MVTVQFDPALVEYLDNLVERYLRLYPFEMFSRAALVRKLVYEGALRFEQELVVREQQTPAVPYQTSPRVPRGISARTPPVSTPGGPRKYRRR